MIEERPGQQSTWHND